jgi:hypothetical protein
MANVPMMTALETLPSKWNGDGVGLAFFAGERIGGFGVNRSLPLNQSTGSIDRHARKTVRSRQRVLEMQTASTSLDSGLTKYRR